MKLRNSQLWALCVAAAFLLLWAASVGVTFASSPQEPVSGEVEAMAPAETAKGTEVIGILGWCLVGVGFLGVALTAALGGKPRRRRKPARVSGLPRHLSRVSRSVYSPPPYRRYHRNVERRF